MITLVISICASAALTDCTETQRLPMPASMTVPDCNKVARVMESDEAGNLIIPAQFKKVICEKA
jgi:hypothetical protein